MKSTIALSATHRRPQRQSIWLSTPHPICMTSCAGTQTKAFLLPQNVFLSSNDFVLELTVQMPSLVAENNIRKILS
jgi:hypothetical protein